jgi:hypothetical protein
MQVREFGPGNLDTIAYAEGSKVPHHLTFQTRNEDSYVIFSSQP